MLGGLDVKYGDWRPTHEHYPIPKRNGGREAVDNAILAHLLCNRLDYSIAVGRPHAKDLERIRKAREEAIRLTAAMESASSDRIVGVYSRRGFDLVDLSHPRLEPGVQRYLNEQKGIADTTSEGPEDALL